MHICIYLYIYIWLYMYVVLYIRCVYNNHIVNLCRYTNSTFFLASGMLLALNFVDKVQDYVETFSCIAVRWKLCDSKFLFNQRHLSHFSLHSGCPATGQNRPFLKTRTLSKSSKRWACAQMEELYLMILWATLGSFLLFRFAMVPGTLRF